MHMPMSGSSLRITPFLALVLLLAAHGSLQAQSSADQASLYERLGGLPGIALVVSDFVDAFIADPLIMDNPAVRERKTPQEAPYVKYQVTTLVCEATGGPCAYTGLDMRTAHDGLNVSEREWDRMVEIFLGTLHEHRVPDREVGELLAILGPSKAEIVTGSR
jgi:hemoglobin